jgi:hypothetical protein
MKKKFKLTLRIKACEKQFHPDLPLGVLVVQTEEYDLSDAELKSNLFIVHLCDREQEFLNEHIEVTTEEME